MTFLQRLGFYSGGLVLGLIVVAFFFSGKKSSCSYSPTARFLKNIRIKDHIYTQQSITFLVKNQMDTTAVNYILENGTVDFGASNTELHSCKTYIITSRKKDSLQLKLNIKNCTKKATILSIEDFK